MLVIEGCVTSSSLSLNFNILCSWRLWKTFDKSLFNAHRSLFLHALWSLILSLNIAIMWCCDFRTGMLTFLDHDLHHHSCGSIFVRHLVVMIFFSYESEMWACGYELISFDLPPHRLSATTDICSCIKQLAKIWMCLCSHSLNMVARTTVPRWSVYITLYCLWSGRIPKNLLDRVSQLH